MPRAKRPRRKKQELLARHVEVSETAVWFSASASQQRGAEPEFGGSASVTIRGTLEEPVRDARALVATVYASDDVHVGREPTPWIGLVRLDGESVRPAVFLPNREFDRVWTMAVSGRLRHAHLVLSAPRYRESFVVSISFSSEREE